VTRHKRDRRPPEIGPAAIFEEWLLISRKKNYASAGFAPIPAPGRARRQSVKPHSIGSPWCYLSALRHGRPGRPDPAAGFRPSRQPSTPNRPNLLWKQQCNRPSEELTRPRSLQARLAAEPPTAWSLGAPPCIATLAAPLPTTPACVRCRHTRPQREAPVYASHERDEPPLTCVDCTASTGRRCAGSLAPMLEPHLSASQPCRLASSPLADSTPSNSYGPCARPVRRRQTRHFKPKTRAEAPKTALSPDQPAKPSILDRCPAHAFSRPRSSSRCLCCRLITRRKASPLP